MSKALTEMVTNCPVCVKASAVHKEPLMPTPLPDYPWQVVGSDLFSLKGDQYLVVVDYFSRFPEVTKLSSTVSASIIAALRHLFARYGDCQKYFVAITDHSTARRSLRSS